MKTRLHHQRGAVLVETTLVAGMILTMLLFSIQVGVLGFLQITADTASFVDSHLHSTGTVNQSANIEAATSNALPQIAPGDITTTPVPAPTASIPVNYGYNGSASQIAQSGNNRYGGVTMMQPTLIQTNVRPHEMLDVLGSKVGVAAQHVEPQWQECGSHFNVTNASNLTCGGSGAVGGFQTDYFNGGENTPPYYVGFNYIKHCSDQQPWWTCSGSGAQPGIDFIAFGQAEFLDAHNAGRAQPGISGGCDEATFYEAAYHQRYYSQLAQFFNNYGSLQSLYSAYGGAPGARGTIFNAMAGDAPVSDFATWQEFENSAAGQNADTIIDKIYSWDEHVQQGYTYTSTSQPGTYPLHPDGGCH